jgi:hypothetical protein
MNPRVELCSNGTKSEETTTMNGPRGGGYERMRQMRLAQPWGNGEGPLCGLDWHAALSSECWRDTTSAS